jgi:hypothetical protein
VAVQALCRQPANGKGDTWQQPVQPGSTGSDPFGHYAVRWQTAKVSGSLPSASGRQIKRVADGKEHGGVTLCHGSADVRK